MVFSNFFAFMVVLSSGNVSTTITAFSNIDISQVEYYDYEYEYEENKSITIQGINTIDIDLSLNLLNVSVLDNETLTSENGDVQRYVYNFDMEIFIGVLESFKENDYSAFEKFVLIEKRLSSQWFELYLNYINISFNNSYEIVPIPNENDNSGYRVISDLYLDIYLMFEESFDYNFIIEEFEFIDIVSENGFNVGMSFGVIYDVSGDFLYSTSEDLYFNYYEYLYNVGNENGLFQGRQEGYRTGYDDAIMSQPSSVLELVTKPFVEMGKFLNISIAPNLTLGMIIAIPIIIAVVGFLIKALIA